MDIELSYSKSGKKEVLKDMKGIQLDFDSEGIIISHSLNRDYKEYIDFKTVNSITIKEKAE